MEGGGVEDFVVALLVEGLPEEDVVLEGCVLDPGLLGGVGEPPRHAHAPPQLHHLAGDGAEEGGLAGADGAADPHQRPLLHRQGQPETLHRPPLQRQ